MASAAVDWDDKRSVAEAVVAALRSAGATEASRGGSAADDAASTSPVAAASALTQWGSVTAGDAVVTNCSGNGGNRTFKVSFGDGGPPPVAMHALTDEVLVSDPTFIPRMRSAGQAFAAAGLAPPRLAEGDGGAWFVDRWQGTTLGEPTFLHGATVALVRDIGTLLARVQACSNGRWYDAHREGMCITYPSLRDVDPGSHIWWFAGKAKRFFDGIADDALRKFADAGPHPVSTSCKRVVATQGDLNVANLLRLDAHEETGGGEESDGARDGGDKRDDSDIAPEPSYRVIDFEHACVTSAVIDLSFAFFVWCRTDEHKREFTHAYVQAAGLPHADTDVFAARLDAERCMIKVSTFPETLSALAETGSMGARYDRLAELADAALTDPLLARDIVRNGIHGCRAARRIDVDLRPWTRGAYVTARATAAEATRDTAGAGAATGGPDASDKAHEATTRFDVHWDGTVGPRVPDGDGAESRRGFRLGVDGDGCVVLTSLWYDAVRPLRVATTGAGAAPVTGLAVPASPAVPLTLGGNHAGQSVVLSGGEDEFWGERLVYCAVKPVAGRAPLRVHIEVSGLIRTADDPNLALQCSNPAFAAGSSVSLAYASGGPQQRFRVHDDGTVGPIMSDVGDAATGSDGASKTSKLQAMGPSLAGSKRVPVVLGSHDGRLVLVPADAPDDERLVFTDVAAASDSPGEAVLTPASVRDKDAPLVLEQPAGCSLCVAPIDVSQLTSKDTPTATAAAEASTDITASIAGAPLQGVRVSAAAAPKHPRVSLVLTPTGELCDASHTVCVGVGSVSR